MFSIGLEFSLPQLQRDAPRRVRARARAGRDHDRRGRRVARIVAGLRLAGRPGARRRARDELDRDRDRRCSPSAASSRRRTAATSSGILLFQDLAVVAFLIVIPSLDAEGDDARGARSGSPRVKAAVALASCCYARPAADALVVPRRRAPALARALHAQRAAGHARARRAHRARRAVARARRLPRRHADRRDRVPLPGRGGHHAVPRRAARAVLRHRRHGARPARRRRRNFGWVLAAARRAGRGEARADRRARARCSARRSRPRCAPASTSRRRASSRS